MREQKNIRLSVSGFGLRPFFILWGNQEARDGGGGFFPESGTLFYASTDLPASPREKAGRGLEATHAFL